MSCRSAARSKHQLSHTCIQPFTRTVRHDGQEVKACHKDEQRAHCVLLLGLGREKVPNSIILHRLHGGWAVKPRDSQSMGRAGLTSVSTPPPQLPPHYPHTTPTLPHVPFTQG